MSTHKKSVIGSLGVRTTPFEVPSEIGGLASHEGMELLGELSEYLLDRAAGEELGPHDPMVREVARRTVSTVCIDMFRTTMTDGQLEGVRDGGGNRTSIETARISAIASLAIEARKETAERASRPFGF